ncbi:hypothetical protein T261_7465 [Streptomyces lydicus]|nr:hypothetical protein T261_7465 [Streptomyces lydicus]
MGRRWWLYAHAAPPGVIGPYGSPLGTVGRRGVTGHER